MPKLKTFLSLVFSLCVALPAFAEVPPDTEFPCAKEVEKYIGLYKELSVQYPDEGQDAERGLDFSDELCDSCLPKESSVLLIQQATNIARCLKSQRALK